MVTEGSPTEVGVRQSCEGQYGSDRAEERRLGGGEGGRAQKAHRPGRASGVVAPWGHWATVSVLVSLSSEWVSGQESNLVNLGESL